MLTEEAVKDFQIAHLLKADGIVGLATWRKLLGYVLKPSSRQIKEIIVHCTATRAGIDCTVEDIRRWHRLQGWSDIGYHYVVYRDGSVHEGRNVNIAGAHCLGHNTYSIGVAYVGGVARDGKTPADTRTVAQAEGLEKLMVELRRMYPQAHIFGHRDFARKACPCFDARKCYEGI
jgi:N-acetylmuramoyl-L-alanine amidase